MVVCGAEDHCGGESGVGRAASGLNEVRQGGRRRWTRCRRGRCWRSDHVGNRPGGGPPSIHICSQFRAGLVRQKPPFKSREPRRQVGRSIVGGCVCRRRPLEDRRREGVAAAIGAGSMLGRQSDDLSAILQAGERAMQVWKVWRKQIDRHFWAENRSRTTVCQLVSLQKAYTKETLTCARAGTCVNAGPANCPLLIKH